MYFDCTIYITMISLIFWTCYILWLLYVVPQVICVPLINSYYFIWWDRKIYFVAFFYKKYCNTMLANSLSFIDNKVSWKICDGFTYSNSYVSQHSHTLDVICFDYNFPQSFLHCKQPSTLPFALSMTHSFIPSCIQTKKQIKETRNVWYGRELRKQFFPFNIY